MADPKDYIKRTKSKADRRQGNPDRRLNEQEGLTRRSGDDRRRNLRKQATRRVNNRRFSYGRRDNDNPGNFEFERRKEGFERWQGDRRNQNRLLYSKDFPGRRDPEDRVIGGIAGALVKSTKGAPTVTAKNLSGLGKIARKLKGKGGLIGIAAAIGTAVGAAQKELEK